MAIEIVSFPIKKCGSFQSYVKLPEGIYLMREFRPTQLRFEFLAGLVGPMFLGYPYDTSLNATESFTKLH